MTAVNASGTTTPTKPTTNDSASTIQGNSNQTPVDNGGKKSEPFNVKATRAVLQGLFCGAACGLYLTMQRDLFRLPLLTNDLIKVAGSCSVKRVISSMLEDVIKDNLKNYSQKTKDFSEAGVTTAVEIIPQMIQEGVSGKLTNIPLLAVSILPKLYLGNFMGTKTFKAVSENCKLGNMEIPKFFGTLANTALTTVSSGEKFDPTNFGRTFVLRYLAAEMWTTAKDLGSSLTDSIHGNSDTKPTDTNPPADPTAVSS